MEHFTTYKEVQLAETTKQFLLTMKLLKTFDTFVLEQKNHLQAALGVRNPVSDVDVEKYKQWHATTREAILKAIVLSSDAFSQTVTSE